MWEESAATLAHIEQEKQTEEQEKEAEEIEARAEADQIKMDIVHSPQPRPLEPRHGTAMAPIMRHRITMD